MSTATNSSVATVLLNQLRSAHVAVVSAEAKLAELETSFGWNERNEKAELAALNYEIALGNVARYITTLESSTGVK